MYLYHSLAFVSHLRRAEQASSSTALLTQIARLHRAHHFHTVSFWCFISPCVSFISHLYVLKRYYKALWTKVLLCLVKENLEIKKRVFLYSRFWKRQPYSQQLVTEMCLKGCTARSSSDPTTSLCYSFILSAFSSSVSAFVCFFLIFFWQIIKDWILQSHIFLVSILSTYNDHLLCLVLGVLWSSETIDWFISLPLMT